MRRKAKLIQTALFGVVIAGLLGLAACGNDATLAVKPIVEPSPTAVPQQGE